MFGNFDENFRIFFEDIFYSAEDFYSKGTFFIRKIKMVDNLRKFAIIVVKFHECFRLLGKFFAELRAVYEP